jgi:hypothetical protein
MIIIFITFTYYQLFIIITFTYHESFIIICLLWEVLPTFRQIYGNNVVTLSSTLRIKCGALGKEEWASRVDISR